MRKPTEAESITLFESLQKQMDVLHTNGRGFPAMYQAIEDTVISAVSRGELNAGDQLPSVRALSDLLGLNPNTVAKSYRDLEVMGMVYTRRGMGVFISKDNCARIVKEHVKGLRSRAENAVEALRSAGVDVTLKVA